MIYRENRLSRRHKIWLLPHPPSPVSKLDQRHTGRLAKRDNLLTGEGGGGGGEAQSTQSSNGRFLAYIPSMRVKLAQAGMGGGCTPTPFPYIYHHQ